jgi:hypothetical protein
MDKQGLYTEGTDIRSYIKAPLLGKVEPVFSVTTD